MKIKTILLNAVIILSGLLCACSPGGPRTVEMPFINFSNNSTIDIVKVELTDSNTVLDINAYYRPGYWIRIAPETTLETNGKKYALVGAEGIEPGKEHWMPESGESSFKLIFEPLPFDTKQFDFNEGDTEGAYKLLDIDITGKPQSKYPKGLPDRFKKAPIDEPVPQPAFEMGKTTVNVHILPYRKELKSKIPLHVSGMDSNYETYEITIDDDGNGSVSFDQYGTATARLVDGYNLLGTYTLYPGETTDLYVDGRAIGSSAMSNREGFGNCAYVTNNHTGHYSNMDRMKVYDGYDNFYKYRIKRDWVDYHMTAPEYMAALKTVYEANQDSIAALQAPAMAKELMNLYLKDDVLRAVSNMRFILENNYRIVHNDWESRTLPADSITAYPTDEDFAEVISWVDVNDPRLVTIGGDALGRFDWNNKGVEGDLSKSLVMFALMTPRAKATKLNDVNRQVLQDLSNPFFAEACDSIQARATRAAMELMERANITPTPAVVPDKVFDAIIAPHKGKVVMVDLWNTWCAPCRAALAANEPLKTGELNSEDIVWIYIADESSDHLKYLEMIPDIKGIHYKVSTEEFKAISDHFEVDGIPYYILVDRNGKAEGRPDLRDHSKYIKEIKSKL